VDNLRHFIQRQVQAWGGVQQFTQSLLSIQQQCTGQCFWLGDPALQALGDGEQHPQQQNGLQISQGLDGNFLL